jgi:hypothetical protein
MKHNITQTENYLLIVDDSEIKVGDWCIMFDSVGNVFSNPQQYTNPETQHLNKGLKKITAHLPLNNLPVLEGVDLLLPIEDDDTALNTVIQILGSSKTTTVGDFLEKHRKKYKYTEEHLRKAIDMARMNYDEEGFTINAFTEYEVIQSIQQPKMPVGFECEMEICENNDVVFEDGSFNKSPYRLEKKKIKNSQGQTVWVGKYIFND